MTQTTNSAKMTSAAGQAAPTWKPGVSGPVTGRRTPSHFLRIALLTLAVVVLLAVAFVVGRATADSTPAHGPAAVTPASQTSNYICRVGRPC